MLRTTKA